MARDRRTPRNSGFERLWFGTAASNLADGILVSAAPLLATTITRDPVLIAGLVVAQRLPWLVFTLISGALVDRIDRRLLLVAANWGRAATLGLLALSLALDVRNLAVLYATVFVLGIAETIEDTAALAVLPAIVDRTQLERANGRIYAAQSVFNELIGPPIGGLLFAGAAVAAFATGGVAFAVAALVLAALPLARSLPPESGHEPMIAAIRQGFAWFWRNRLIRTVALMSGAVNLFTFAGLSVLVLVAQQRLGLDAGGYGLLLAGGAVGGVVGGLLADRIVAMLGSGRAIFASNL
ncbi:MAG: MFS transporter, partial [Actinomycetota bacterium]